MKIVHCASSHKIGLTNQEMNLALAYSRQSDVQLIVVTGEKEQFAGSHEELVCANIETVKIPGFDDHQDAHRLICEFIKLTRRHCPDIVTVNTNWQLIIVAVARFFSQKKYRIVYTIHGFRHNEPFKSIIARLFIGVLLFLFADKINAPSRYVRKKFSALSYKTETIPLGEDEVFFDNRALPDFSASPVFCFPGEFRSGKNQDMLIRAFARFVRHTGDQDAKLVLPGKGSLLADHQALAKELGVSSQVSFPGQIDRNNMLAIYHESQFVVVCSNKETFGHCVAEPLVMQRIVISRSVGIAPDFIRHGSNGFLFDTEQELFDLLLKVVSLPLTELEKIARAAGDVGGNFRWSFIAQENIKRLMKPLL